VAKKHSTEQLAAWARENGLKRYQQYHPQEKLKREREGIANWNKRNSKNTPHYDRRVPRR